MSIFWPKPGPSQWCAVAVIVRAGSNTGVPIVGATVTITWPEANGSVVGTTFNTTK